MSPRILHHIVASAVIEFISHDGRHKDSKMALSALPIVKIYRDQREVSGDKSIAQGLPYLYVACAVFCTLPLNALVQPSVHLPRRQPGAVSCITQRGLTLAPRIFGQHLHPAHPGRRSHAILWAGVRLIGGERRKSTNHMPSVTYSTFVLTPHPILMKTRGLGSWY